MERKLVSIQVIDAINPIEGADNIEVATIQGWKVVIKKGEYKVGDKVIYFEVDSFLPIRPEYEFLRPSSFKTLYDGSEGFRIRTIKLRKQISQGLVMPIDMLPFDDTGITQEYQVGDDVTNIMSVKKWEVPLSAHLQGLIKGSFPSF